MVMNAQAWLTVVALIVTIFTSPTFVAELFTNFDIMPREIGPGQETVIVKNTGLAQADNVVLQIGVNGVIDNYKDRCAEGEVRKQLDDSILVVEFSRMSPGAVCPIELTVSKPVSLNMVVSSDDRVIEWRSWERWSDLHLRFMVWFGAIAAEIVILALLIYLFPRSERLNYERFKRRERRLARTSKVGFDVASKANVIKKFVYDEYELDINEIDATILELIYFQKTTLAQIRKNSRLDMPQIKYRVRKMRRYELVSKEKLELHVTLNDFFDQLWQDAYKDWKASQLQEHNRFQDQ